MRAHAVRNHAEPFIAALPSEEGRPVASTTLCPAQCCPAGKCGTGRDTLGHLLVHKHEKAAEGSNSSSQQGKAKEGVGLVINQSRYSSVDCHCSFKRGEGSPLPAPTCHVPASQGQEAGYHHCSPSKARALLHRLELHITCSSLWCLCATVNDVRVGFRTPTTTGLPSHSYKHSFTQHYATLYIEHTHIGNALQLVTVSSPPPRNSDPGENPGGPPRNT